MLSLAGLEHLLDGQLTSGDQWQVYAQNAFTVETYT